jgi:hypothetical protein
MFGVRILLFMTAYVVVMLEVYSGVILGPWWWILPGALVIALLIAISMFVLAPASGEKAKAGFFQWLLLIICSLAIAGSANYLGRETFPELIAARPA